VKETWLLPPPFLFRFGRFEAMIQERGTLARHDFLDICLMRAVPLLDLFGTAFLGRLTEFRGNGGWVNQFLRRRRQSGRDRKHGCKDEMFHGNTSSIKS